MVCRHVLHCISTIVCYTSGSNLIYIGHDHLPYRLTYYKHTEEYDQTFGLQLNYIYFAGNIYFAGFFSRINNFEETINQSIIRNVEIPYNAIKEL